MQLQEVPLILCTCTGNRIYVVLSEDLVDLLEVPIKIKATNYNEI